MSFSVGMILLVATVCFSLGWISAGYRDSKPRHISTIFTRPVGLTRTGDYDPASGFYRAYLIRTGETTTRLEPNPPEGTECWVMTLGPDITVNLYRVRD